MKVPLKLELDASSITLEPDSNGASEIPMITLGLNIKIPVMKLVGALTDFQNKHERATPSAKQAPPEKAEPKAQHGEAVRGRAPPVAPTPAPTHSESQVLANGDGGGDGGGGPLRGLVSGATDLTQAPGAGQAPPPPPPLSSMPPGPAPGPPPRVENSQGALFSAEWTTEISFLHSAGHDEYARKVNWRHYITQPEVESYWRCDEACFATFEPLPLDAPRLIYKKSQWTEEPAAEPLGEIIPTRQPPPPGAPPPPPSSPPPAANVEGEDLAGNGTSASINDAYDAPPGLPAPQQAPPEAGAAPPSAPGVPGSGPAAGGGSRSPGNKECKQQ